MGIVSSLYWLIAGISKGIRIGASKCEFITVAVSADVLQISVFSTDEKFNSDNSFPDHIIDDAVWYVVVLDAV